MNSEKTTVGLLIAQWLEVIMLGTHQARKNAKRMSEGLQTRIKPKSNKQPRVLDHKTHIRQKAIQAKLVKILPNLKPIICSEPVMTDYAWKVSDYIDLYYDHYIIVIQKLCEMTSSVR